MTSQFPVLTYGKVRLLNVPHAEAVAREIFDEDCYAFDLIPEGAVVFGVGAFYGEFALRCVLEKNCLAYAFEPSAANLEILELNRKLNHYPDRLLTFGRAVGRLGPCAFVSRPDHPAGSMLADGAARHGITGTVAEVPCMAIGDVLSVADSGAPVVVKLDCEGAEREIFEDTAWLDNVSVLVMEWHDHDGACFRDLVEARGFDVQLQGGGPKPRPAWDPSIGGGLLWATRKATS